MENKDISVATEVIKLLKQSIKRLYILLIIFIVMFIISLADSLYQRYKIVELLKDIEVVEETVTETYDMSTEDGNNNYVGGDNNGKIENN